MLPLDLNRVVFTGSNFLIYNISDLLPRHRHFPFGSDVLNPNTGMKEVLGSYKEAPGRNINHIITHQTLGGYGVADKQVFRTGEFFVKDPNWKQKGTKWVWTGEGRGWPGFAYTWFVPFSPLVYYTDAGERLIIYQCNSLDLITWHTGFGMNSNGGGLAFQGYFLEEDAGVKTPLKGTDGEPSEAQLEILPAFWLEYGVPVLGASTLTGHWEHGKHSCPGRTLREKVCEIRGH